VAWTIEEKEFLAINYLRMNNEELAGALGKSVSGVASRLARQVVSRTVVGARDRDWDLPFGCQVTKYLRHIDELWSCECCLQAKGVPYIISESALGFAIYRANMGNLDIDGEEPPRSLWVKCHNHPVFSMALP